MKSNIDVSIYMFKMYLYNVQNVQHYIYQNVQKNDKWWKNDLTT